MSVQRSPPSLRQLDPPINIIHYNSDSALNVSNASDGTDNYFNTTKRQKRTFDEVREQPGYSNEIKYMLDQIMTQQETKFDLLNNTLATVMTQNQAIQKSVETLTNKHDALLMKISQLERENGAYRERISTLERNLDSLERSVRRSTIEIRNLPSQEHENKALLIETIQQVGLTLGLETPIHKSEIKDIFRTRSAVVVDFTTSFRRDSMISMYKSYNKSKRDKKEPQLNTESIKLPGAPCTLYISEYLTSKARHLFYMARSSVKTKKLFKAWTSSGKVYIKREADSAPTRIEEESDVLQHTM
ncbi:unnamed protein product [Arctia plantaginis]|uniref:Zinc finger DNA binding protein n=1 Tax=Arctia plantaginis TaxID=874455 RepID=A0A8S1AEW3_ARCPL|nr:unnamed protein product [Arctia plantaginis]